MAAQEDRLAAAERDAPFTTISGEPIKALYTEGHLPADPQAIESPESPMF